MMIKKIIWLLVLGAAIYIGYLAWNNLKPNEKQKVLNLGEKVTDKTKDLAKSAAETITDQTKKVIQKEPTPSSH